MKAMTLRLTVDQHTKLKMAAETMGVSVQQFVSDAIDCRLAYMQHEYQPTGSNGMRYCTKCMEVEADPDELCPNEPTGKHQHKVVSR